MKEIDGVKYYSAREISDNIVVGMTNANEKLADNKDGGADGFMLMMISIQTAIVGAEIRRAILGDVDE